MEFLLHLIPSIAIILEPTFSISDKPGASAEDVSTQARQAAVLCYDTANGIAAMPRCKAETERRFVSCLLMRIADGSKTTLQYAQFYVLPDAFLDWQKTPQPRPHSTNNPNP